MKDYGMSDFVSTETHGVIAVANLQHATANGVAVPARKILDEIAIDRFAAEAPGDWRRPAQIAEIDWRRDRAKPPLVETRPRRSRSKTALGSNALAVG